MGVEIWSNVSRQKASRVSPPDSGAMVGKRESKDAVAYTIESLCYDPEGGVFASRLCTWISFSVYLIISCPLSLVRINEELLERKIAAPV
jgi:hypothetical protein